MVGIGYVLSVSLTKVSFGAKVVGWVMKGGRLSETRSYSLPKLSGETCGRSG
jgi:hypothetical protein